MTSELHPSHWVAQGPYPESEWCVIDDSTPRELWAPGRVVLCHTGTRRPHDQAELAARSARELLAYWLDPTQKRPV